MTLWGMAQYTQEGTLSAGNYTITYNALNIQSVDKKLFGLIDADGTKYLSDKTTFAVGQWEETTLKFILYQETTGNFCRLLWYAFISFYISRLFILY